jgi:hypothetical protein
MATILGFTIGTFYALYVRVRYVGQKRITIKKSTGYGSSYNRC